MFQKGNQKDACSNPEDDVRLFCWHFSFLFFFFFLFPLFFVLSFFLTCIESATPCNATWHVLEPCVAKTCHMGIDHQEGWKHMCGTFLMSQVMRLKVRLGHAKQSESVCFVILNISFTPTPCFWSWLPWWPWWPHLIYIPWDGWIGSYPQCFASNIFQTLMVAWAMLVIVGVTLTWIQGHSSDAFFFQMFARYCYRTWTVSGCGGVHVCMCVCVNECVCVHVCVPGGLFHYSRAIWRAFFAQKVQR